MPMSEFQPVVLAAGKGSRYTELTSRKAKCLLPIGSKPMIWYPLQLLERNGYQEAFIIVNENIKSDILLAIESTGLNIVPNFLCIPSGEDWGTADSLKYFSEYFKSDLIVISCDLLTNVDLQKVLNVYRKHNTTLTTLMFSYTSPAALTIPGPKSKNKIERDVVGIDPITNRLVFLASASDFEEYLPISLNLLKKHGRIKMFSKLLDSHLYVINHGIIDYLANEDSISTIKGELLPHIINKQNSRKNNLSRNKGLSDVSGNIADKDKQIYQFLKEDDFSLKIRNISLFNDKISNAYNNDVVRCYAYIAGSNEYAVRANTLFEYYKINKEIYKKFSDITKLNSDIHNISPLAQISSTQLDRENCTVGEYSNIAEKTSIKNTTISSKVLVKCKTRIIDSIIMNGVSIGENCVVSNSILCNDCVIEDNCNITNCIIGSHYVVQKDSNLSSGIFTDVDRLMEI